MFDYLTATKREFGREASTHRSLDQTSQLD